MAASQNDWQTVRDKADAALAFDPENPDGKGYLEAAMRRLPRERECSDFGTFVV